jgi:glycosyltransferase involved in cell wall biosynthesis
MKILIASHAFSPSIGGIESVSLRMACEFAKQGHQIKIVTQSTSDDLADDHGFEVLRQPRPRALFDAVRWCDVFWHNNLGIRVVWPLLFLKRGFVVTHAGSYCEIPSGLQLATRLKHAIVNRSTSISISTYVASCFAGESIIIPNPYDADTFTTTSGEDARPLDLIFVGRLVTQKGPDILLQSMRRVTDAGCTPNLTVVGVGPELPRLQQLVTALGLDSQVTFAGAQSGHQLASTMKQHKIAVIPSRFEAFGVVALEAIACGCAVIASDTRGLPETVGPCGIVFNSEDTEDLASAIMRLLGDPHEVGRLTAQGAKHLSRFHPSSVARAYLDVFRAATAG